jgi:hypothetical protein
MLREFAPDPETRSFRSAPLWVREALREGCRSARLFHLQRQDEQTLVAEALA